MTKRDRSAVTATLDVDTARSMSDAGLARAQASLMAQMMTAKDILSYDYTASHNFINPVGLARATATLTTSIMTCFQTGLRSTPRATKLGARLGAKHQ